MSIRLRWQWQWSVVALLPVLGGCDSRSTPSQPEAVLAAVAPTVPLTPKIVQGHFRGTATRADQDYHAEALLTADGEVRLYLGGPGSVAAIESGAGLGAAQLDPAESILFVGRLEMGGAALTARGTATGQVCTAASVRRLCGEAAPAVVTLVTKGSASFPGNRLSGEIRVTTAGTELAWRVELWRWSIFYDSPAPVGGFEGTYRETLAPFAHGDDVIITIDRSGRLFFQSPISDCTGNGTLAPHADGAAEVWDVNLVIENCRADYAYLNGDFAGLATATQNGGWDYDDWLVTFLSTRDGSAVPAAVTMFAYLIYP